MARTSAKLGVALAAALAGLSAAAAADLPVKAPPYVPVAVESGPWINPFAGFAASPHSVFGDAGAVFALNHNLNVDGWLFRIRGGVGEYSYDRTQTLRQTVDWGLGEAMIGYQKYLGGVRLSGYIGAEVQQHNNNDPLAVIAGTKWGLKGQGEIFAPLGGNMYFLALGTVSSVWTSYFTMAKLGYMVTPGVAVGPEVAALGNIRFDAQRVGPFVAFDIGPGQIIFSGGYQWAQNQNNVTGRNDNGAYGTVHLRANF